MFRLLKHLPIAAFCLAITATSAKANWQFTKWGMSPKELEQVSPVKLRVKISTGDNCPAKNPLGKTYNVRYASDWNVGSMKFIACYLFLDNKLNRVYLTSSNVDAAAIIKGLSQRYGSPQVNTLLSSVGIVSYNWDLLNEEIRFVLRKYEDKELYIVDYKSKKGTNEILIRDGL
ncbi:hypothetical protein [Anabaena sp. UHCC 0451]|uniref:hypothetical protein n=1 Tax=Anabaena sp. UHCC 0451 TaxID=2055235 RepID=UPI002B2197E9|nr:hypothetical protein [Anabaena sp. UHCC 0451]MEA5577469.1 hypothetical protein [Anabaena sp. UHCC 0451]